MRSAAEQCRASRDDAATREQRTEICGSIPDRGPDRPIPRSSRRFRRPPRVSSPISSRAARRAARSGSSPAGIVPAGTSTPVAWTAAAAAAVPTHGSWWMSTAFPTVVPARSAASTRGASWIGTCSAMCTVTSPEATRASARRRWLPTRVGSAAESAPRLKPSTPMPPNHRVLLLICFDERGHRPERVVPRRGGAVHGSSGHGCLL